MNTEQIISRIKMISISLPEIYKEGLEYYYESIIQTLGGTSTNLLAQKQKTDFGDRALRLGEMPQRAFFGAYGFASQHWYIEQGVENVPPLEGLKTVLKALKLHDHIGPLTFLLEELSPQLESIRTYTVRNKVNNQIITQSRNYKEMVEKERALNVFFPIYELMEE